MAETVYIEKRPDARYPKIGYNPSIAYPEYPFGDLQDEENVVYDMVRQCLYGLKLDIENYDTPAWNPLGEYIKPGNNILIKPNWVMHFNGAHNVDQNAMECLVTHPSCLRAICDYCLIALKGEGQIIIGDAPMQDCDLPILLERMRFNDLLKFYEHHGQPVRFADLRKYQSVFNRNSVIIDKIYQNGEGIDVELGAWSMHEQRSGKRVYQVDNYDRFETESYHGANKHTYSVSKTMLEADVVINFCKPKSHRLAGLTAAMKNLVGIAYNKASLPHRVEGSNPEGGDAYPNTSKLKKQVDKALDRKIKHEDKHNLFLATLDRYVYGGLLVLARKVCKDPYIKGIWYGNDTIWRTVVDLNYIARYADKQGSIQKDPQRKILNFADLIIGGEHNGPCQPEPKELGILMASESSPAMDIVICKLIGFDENKIPLIKALKNGDTARLLGEEGKDIDVILNGQTAKLQETVFPDEWHYRPHDSWKEVL